MKYLLQTICLVACLTLSLSCLASGEPVFTATRLDVNTSPSMSSEIGDLDGDLDVPVVRKLSPAAIFLNDGAGTFLLSGQVLPRLDLTDAGIADLDGDGYLDIVLVQDRGPNLILLNDGEGGSKPSTKNWEMAPRSEWRLETLMETRTSICS